MYCAQCGTKLFYKDLENHSFCERCQAVVGVSQCKVSFWSLMAVFTMLWTLSLPA
jgi:hypothetical protein